MKRIVISILLVAIISDTKISYSMDGGDKASGTEGGVVAGETGTSSVEVPEEVLAGSEGGARTRSDSKTSNRTIIANVTFDDDDQSDQQATINNASEKIDVADPIQEYTNTIVDSLHETLLTRTGHWIIDHTRALFTHEKTAEDFAQDRVGKKIIRALQNIKDTSIHNEIMTKLSQDTKLDKTTTARIAVKLLLVKNIESKGEVKKETLKNFIFYRDTIKAKTVQDIDAILKNSDISLSDNEYETINKFLQDQSSTEKQEQLSKLISDYKKIEKLAKKLIEKGREKYSNDPIFYGARRWTIETILKIKEISIQDKIKYLEQIKQLKKETLSSPLSQLSSIDAIKATDIDPLKDLIIKTEYTHPITDDERTKYTHYTLNLPESLPIRIIGKLTDQQKREISQSLKDVKIKYGETSSEIEGKIRQKLQQDNLLSLQIEIKAIPKVDEMRKLHSSMHGRPSSISHDSDILDKIKDIQIDKDTMNLNMPYIWDDEALGNFKEGLTREKYDEVFKDDSSILSHKSGRYLSFGPEKSAIIQLLQEVKKDTTSKKTEIQEKFLDDLIEISTNYTTEKNSSELRDIFNFLKSPNGSDSSGNFMSKAIDLVKQYQLLIETKEKVKDKLPKELISSIAGNNEISMEDRTKILIFLAEQNSIKVE